MTCNLVNKKNAIHILSNVSRSKYHGRIKFGQLTEYNMRNYSFKNSCTECVRETIPRPFCKKSKIEHISGSIV